MSTNADAETPAAPPRPCPPCRGTGTLISKLGGEESSVPCPWCGAEGMTVPGRDAQNFAPGAPPPAVASEV